MYNPETHKLGREITWKLGQREVQYDRGVPLRPLPGNQAKAPLSPRSQVRERHVTQRMEHDWVSQAMDLDCYAAHFALGPEAQAEVARRVREDVERNAAKQAAAEAKRGSDEMERVEKARIEKELKEATAAKLKEHRRPQQGQRVEYQVLRSGLDCGQPWASDDEIREILRKDPRASGTVYGAHFAIRFKHKQMVPTQVLLADAPGETAQAEL